MNNKLTLTLYIGEGEQLSFDNHTLQGGTAKKGILVINDGNLSASGQIFNDPTKNGMAENKWTCPAGVTSVTVECWGGGGAGGAGTATAGRAGGGGGGGSYTSSTLSVVPTTVYTITVGAGGVLGGTSSPTFGGNGGFSEFALNGTPLVKASGGTGGGGGTTTATGGSGGVLGGVYDFMITNFGTGYTSGPTVTITSSNGVGAGATAGAARNSTTTGISYISSRVQATTAYTAAPTVSFSGGGGSGAEATALVNLSVDLGTTIMSSPNGSAGVFNTGSGAGGAGANGGAGGASITTQGNGGIAGTAPGGGGSGGYTGSTGGAKNGGLGADGQVKISYTTIPVEWVYFQAKNNQKTNLLTWKTASEKENAFFEIQQSTNGTDFQTIGEVKGHGTTALPNTYNFEHTTPSVGVNYYRLKQVDFNGSSRLSSVRAVLFGKNGLVVKPTLVSDALDILVSDEKPTTIHIINTVGQTVLVKKVQGAQRFDVSALPIGLYFVRSETGEVARFVKQ